MRLMIIQRLLLARALFRRALRALRALCWVRPDEAACLRGGIQKRSSWSWSLDLL